MCFGTGDRVGVQTFAFPICGDMFSYRPLTNRAGSGADGPSLVTSMPRGQCCRADLSAGRWAFGPACRLPDAKASSGNFPRNQNLTSRRECSRPREPMAHSDSPATPGAPRAAAGGGVRMVRVPDDRAGQRLDNFLLGQLKGAPKSLVYKIVRSGQVRVNGGRAKADTRLEIGRAHV